MQNVLKSLFVAGIIGSSALLGGPSYASAKDAGALFSQLQQSGAETSYVRGRGFRGGGVRVGGRALGGRGFGNRGFAGRGGFGRRGLAGRGFGGRGFGGRGFGNRGFAGRPRYGYGYGYRRRGIGAGAVVGGLAAGALLGGAIAAQAAPGPVYDAPGGNDAYCSQKFKSYDPASGTYLGYDGQRHPCP